MTVPALEVLTVSRNFLTYIFRRYNNNAIRKVRFVLICHALYKNKKCDLLTVMKFIPKIWTCSVLIFFKRNVIKVLFLLNF